MRFSPIAAGVAAVLVLPLVSQASSHREAPNIALMPAVDSTDVYAFMSYEQGRGEYVTLLADYVPLQDPYGGPNYFALDQRAIYEIHVDSDGDAREDTTFQFRFDNFLGGTGRTGLSVPVGDKQIAVPLQNIGPVVSGSANAATLNFNESFRLSVIQGDRRGGARTEAANPANSGSFSFRKPHDYAGTKSFGSSAEYETYARQYIHSVSLPNCSAPAKVFVGQRNEPFAVNLGPVFDLVNLVPIDATAFPGGIAQSAANDALRGKNVTTIALEVHKSCLTGNGNGVIGVWTTASKRQAQIFNPRPNFETATVNQGAYTQLSRLGMPLVNEVVIGLPSKDRFNASQPRSDAQFAKFVTNPSLPFLIDALFRDAVNATLGTQIANLAPNNLPRNDLVATFLTGFKGVNQQSTVTPSEMLRLNTGIVPTPKETQSAFGVAGGDLAGFPNGRRPGDDVVDIALRVSMGALCYPLMIGGQSVDLGLCTPANAPVGNVPVTDGAPISAAEFDAVFPYLTTPIPGAGPGSY
jgi:hypothetical protein